MSPCYKVYLIYNDLLEFFPKFVYNVKLIQMNRSLKQTMLNKVNFLKQKRFTYLLLEIVSDSNRRHWLRFRLTFVEFKNLRSMSKFKNHFLPSILIQPIDSVASLSPFRTGIFDYFENRQNQVSLRITRVNRFPYHRWW